MYTPALTVHGWGVSEPSHLVQDVWTKFRTSLSLPLYLPPRSLPPSLFFSISLSSPLFLFLFLSLSPWRCLWSMTDWSLCCRYLRRDRRTLDLRMGKLFTAHPHLECCPTQVSHASRQVGIDRHGIIVELLATQNFTQKFYEIRCRAAFKDRPCNFLDRRHTLQSRCIQQFTYEYALIRTLNEPGSEVRLDLIRVPIGCACRLGFAPGEWRE